MIQLDWAAFENYVESFRHPLRPTCYDERSRDMDTYDTVSLPVQKAPS